MSRTPTTQSSQFRRKHQANSPSPGLQGIVTRSLIEVGGERVEVRLGAEGPSEELPPAEASSEVEAPLMAEMSSAEGAGAGAAVTEDPVVVGLADEHEGRIKVRSAVPQPTEERKVRSRWPLGINPKIEVLRFQIHAADSRTSQNRIIRRMLQKANLEMLFIHHTCVLILSRTAFTDFVFPLIRIFTSHVIVTFASKRFQVVSTEPGLATSDMLSPSKDVKTGTLLTFALILESVAQTKTPIADLSPKRPHKVSSLSIQFRH